MLNGLASVKKNNYYLVDTRGTLTRNSSQPLGRANEIHPYSAGFLALANKFLPVLQSVFSGESERTPGASASPARKHVRPPRASRLDVGWRG